MWPGLSNEGLRKPSGNVLFVNVSVVDSVARPFLLVNATSRHVHGQFRVTNAQHDCNASLAERCDGCGAPASLKERDIAVSFTCKHDDDVMAAATMLLMPVLVAQRAAASQVTFSALTNLGDFWGGYHITTNGVVEVCPRSPPNLLPFSDDLLLCSANGTMLITKDGGRSWERSGLPEELNPSIPPPPWRERVGEPGEKTMGKAVWVDVNPVNVYLCDYPGKPACATATPPPAIVAPDNHSYCDWGISDKTGLPDVFCFKGRGPGHTNVWSGLPHYVSEFCTDCGQGVQLADGTFVFIVTVRFGPDWDSNNHKKAAPCCNSSVATFRSTDGLDWRFSSMAFTFDPSAGYEEGPNELALVLLKDKTTLWAVARVDAGDGQPHGYTKPLWATTSKDGGGT